MNLKTLTFTTYLKNGEVCINHDGKDIPVTNLSAGVTVSGEELEVVNQYRIKGFDEWLEGHNTERSFEEYTRIMNELYKCETRQAIHYTGKQAESEQAKEESVFDIIKNAFKEHCWLIEQYNKKGGEADYQTVAEASEALSKLEYAQQSQSATIKSENDTADYSTGLTDGAVHGRNLCLDVVVKILSASFTPESDAYGVYKILVNKITQLRK